jgi:hypothetical protein
MVISIGRLLDANLRSNPAYHLVPFGHLSSEERVTLQPLLGQNEDFYGLLSPDNSATLGVQSVCRSTAALFQRLSDGAVGSRALRDLGRGGDSEDELAALVLDGVLQVECNGQFVSGLQAHHAIFPRRPPRGEWETLTSRLSVEALKYGQALAISNRLELSARLYCYNREPA